MCRIQRWSVRSLKKHIDSMLYERTALSKEPEKVIQVQLSKLKETDEMTPSLAPPWVTVPLVNTTTEPD